MIERSAANPVTLAVSNFMQNDQVMLPTIRTADSCHWAAQRARSGSI